jgi:hypothetical protein
MVREPLLPPGALNMTWKLPDSFTEPLAMALLSKDTEKSLPALKPDPVILTSSLTFPLLGTTVRTA